ncbi:hypothetical protein DENSPDRAFT_883342 [Dentipellis sp. KUC8613]|nr:hypothetical protein DENSPDRAFT_883342 [Dentipellis sp. KUC8613]
MADDAPVAVNHPDAFDFTPEFDLPSFMGTWHITHTTLPARKSIQNLTITYTPLPGSTTRFTEHTAHPSTEPTRVTPKPAVAAGTNTAAVAPTPTHFTRRGAGLGRLLASPWQVLAFVSSDENATPDTDLAYAVVYAPRTRFAPARLDVLSRAPTGLPRALLAALLARLRDADAVGPDVARLAVGLFEVPRTGVRTSPRS